MNNQQNDNLINPEVKSETKTRFWDFRHKKQYSSFGEKLKDFLLGIIIGSILLIFYPYLQIAVEFSMLIFIEPMRPVLLLIIKFGNPFLLPFYGVRLLLLMPLIYMAFKRKYIFWGMLAGFFILFMIDIEIFKALFRKPYFPYRLHAISLF